MKDDKEAIAGITREITAIYICHIITHRDRRSLNSVIIVISENQIVFM